MLISVRSMRPSLSGVRCSDIDSRTSMNGRAVHYRQHEGCKDRQGHVDVHDGRAEPLLPVAYVMMMLMILIYRYISWFEERYPQSSMAHRRLHCTTTTERVIPCERIQRTACGAC